MLNHFITWHHIPRPLSVMFKFKLLYVRKSKQEQQPWFGYLNNISNHWQRQ